MKNRQTILSSIVVAMALGTAWAVRGKFGHEQGAAWAGAIGGLAVILVAKRSDWYDKVFKIGLATAFGWGVGGMISYGLVVGYGRSSDFVNAWYGLLMLFVIGALYGFLGGGFFGLALTDSKELNIKWHSLLAEMIAFGLLTYGFLINQLEWFMTPPRSELWAACLGASIALAWYIIRNKQKAVLKVAVFSALGAGFGFAFGNFLQVLGASTSFSFNFWNVMEYSIGFFGGLGMAYGTLTSTWPIVDVRQTKRSNFLPILLLMVLIPLVVWDQSFITDRFAFILELGGDEGTIFNIQLIAMVSILVCILIFFTKYHKSSYNSTSVKIIFILYLGLYTFLSFLVTGLYSYPIEQYLYLVNLGIILFTLPYLKDNFELRGDNPKKWLMIFLSMMMAIALFAMVAMYSHGELKGSHDRFETKK